MSDWRIFKGISDVSPGSKEQLPETEWPAPPTWRRFGRHQPIGQIKFAEVCWDEAAKTYQRGQTFCLPPDQDGEKLLNLINAAIYLRRPLLITGNPGTGKTSLAYAIAHELNLGPVLTWPITARSTLREGLYQYDAIARLQAAQALQIKLQIEREKIEREKIEREQANRPIEAPLSAIDDIPIGNYFTLGPLGTAFLPFQKPRVLLIDEIDKSDINLPNDLLNLFEEGEYKIPELARLTKPNADAFNSSGPTDEFVEVQTHDGGVAWIKAGRVGCYEFPIVILTSNGERDFPPAFLRRCLRITMPVPKEAAALTAIVGAHLKDANPVKIQQLVEEFLKRKSGTLAPDQLLNVVFLLTRQFSPSDQDEATLIDQLLQYLE